MKKQDVDFLKTFNLIKIKIISNLGIYKYSSLHWNTIKNYFFMYFAPYKKIDAYNNADVI